MKMYINFMGFEDVLKSLLNLAVVIRFLQERRWKWACSWLRCYYICKDFLLRNTSTMWGRVHLFQGFRKIDMDKWEFANEGFLRGKKHLLRSIKRRKSTQAQQTWSHAWSSTEVEKAGMESELQKLSKEKSLMMQEVVGLQQQHCGTVERMRLVNEKIQAAEQRQKQMVSFLAKLFQKPEFLSRLQQKEQWDIASPRTMRKFVKHEPRKVQSSMEDQIIKYRPDLGKLTLNPYLSQAATKETVGNMSSGADRMPFQIENVASEKLHVAHELLSAQKQVGEEVPSLVTEDPIFKEKNLVSPQEEAHPKYFVSFPEDLGKERNFPEFLSPGIENIVKQEDTWSIGLEAGAGMSSSSNEFRGNLGNYDMPELGVTSGLSDIWDLDFLQGSLGIEGDESSFDHLDSQVSQSKDKSSKRMDP